MLRHIDVAETMRDREKRKRVNRATKREREERERETSHAWLLTMRLYAISGDLDLGEIRLVEDDGLER